MNHHKLNELSSFCGVMCLFLCLAGCGGGGESGPPRAAVEGQVTYEGTPLKKGVIIFVPAEGTSGPKTSASIVDGNFHLPADVGPIVGHHSVEIEAVNDVLAPDDELAIARMRAEGIRRISVVRLPSVYNQRTKLKAEIRADEDNKLTFTLNAKGE